jgi:hypothetical protein
MPRTASIGLQAFDLRQHDLAHPHRQRRRLDGLVLAHELERLIEGQFAVRVQAYQHVGGG